MAHEIKIPAVGESITSASIGEWHKKDGDVVREGEQILTIETDKISTELTAEHDGVLRIGAAEGEEVEIGAVVGHIEEGEGETAPSGDAGEQPAAVPDTGAAEESPVESSKLTEAAERLAKEASLDASALSGTGKGGTITKKDVEAAIEARSKEEAPKGSSAEPAPNRGLSVVDSGADAQDAPKVAGGEGRTSRKKLSPLRRKIATQLVSVQQQAALLTTFNECDMSAVMSLRKQIQESFVAKHGLKLGFMSFFIKAVVDALKAVPMLNARIDGDELVQNHFYDIGVAVGTEKGLIVPVIRDADQKTFADIERDIIDYANKAREGRIQLSDITGGVFTVSNGGVYGSLLSTPIINPPQSGILGMHTIQQRPIAVDGQVVIRPMMYLALSYDHRIVDGKEAVTFLVRIKECIESPSRLLVGA